MKQLLHDFVGILAPFVLLLVLMMTIMHLCQNYKGTDKRILIISKFSLVCTILSLICVILTYYKPYLMDNICICQLLWKLSLICFITGIYSVKFTYIVRVYIYFRGPSSDGNFTGKVPKSVYILIFSMIISYLVSITLQIILAHGECFERDINIHGCMNDFDDRDVYVAFVMIAVDIILFYWYSKTWNDKIHLIIKHSPESIKIENQKLLNSFRKQLILTTLALFVTTIDGILHLIKSEYFVINMFIVDNFMVCSIFIVR